MNKKIYSLLLCSLMLTHVNTSKAAHHRVEVTGKTPIETQNTIDINIKADISLLAAPVGFAGLWLTFKGFTKAHKRKKLHTFLQILTGSTTTLASFIFLTNPKKYSQWIGDFIEKQLFSTDPIKN